MNQTQVLLSILRERKLFLAALALFVVGVLSPVLLLSTQRTNALSLASRSYSLSDNRTSQAGVTYTFRATVPTGGSSTLGSIEVILCNNATGPLLGTACSAPAGLAFSGSTLANPVPPAGTPTLNGAATGQTPNVNLGTGSTARIRVTYATPQTVTPGTTEVSFDITGITNPSSGGTFFARMGFFSDSAWTTLTDSGAMAQSVQDAVHVTFRVQETLSFCVGSIDTTIVADPDTADFTANNLTDCSGTNLGDANINLGIGGASEVNVTPVTSGGAQDGDDRVGVAMLATNAAGPVSINYRPVLNAGSGELKVNSVSCNANPSTVNTDQCINSAGATRVAIPTTLSVERFGMGASAVNTVSRETTTLSRTTNYNGDGTGAWPAGCSTGSGICWAWDPATSGTAIVSGSGAVDYEAVILRFASKPALTTPAGSYQISVDFFSVATY